MSKTRFWFEVELERLDAERMRVRGRGSRHEETGWTEVALRPWHDFTESVKRAVDEQSPLDVHRASARALYDAVFQGELLKVWEGLRGAADKEPVLLDWKAQDLEEIPLEALCELSKADDPGAFLGLSTKVLPVRSVPVGGAWEPWQVSGAVRVLPVAPLHEADLTLLRGALGESLQRGEVEWLEPVTGQGARRNRLLDRLGTAKTEAHVLLFVGHIGFEKGEPCLRLADEAEGEESWMPVADLAAVLEGRFSRNLRLVVLQACEGAKPGVVASAAERLLNKGASAVMAHLWKARADVARQASAAFLKALTRGEQSRGNVAASLNLARQAVWNRPSPAHGAEAFSPVLYLRGHEPQLFDFGTRVLKPAAQAPAPVDPQARNALEALWTKPFSLVLGDAWTGERALHARLEARLRERLPAELGGTEKPSAPGLPTSALAQRYALHSSRDQLDRMFQETYQGEMRALQATMDKAEAGGGRGAEALARALALRVKPGVHVTLLRLPLLELALARYRPELTLYVVQPPRRGGAALVSERQVGGGWTQRDALPDALDLERELLVLRLFRGYEPGGEVTTPLLAEDDYLLDTPGLREVLGEDVADSYLEQLVRKPALLVGLSLRDWHHRKLLHELFGRQAPKRGSVALLEPGGPEARLWKQGRGLPGEAGMPVVEGELEPLVRPAGEEAP